MRLKPTIQDKGSLVIRLLSTTDSIGFQELKDKLDLDVSPDEIEDFVFDLIKQGKVSGILEGNKFIKT